jgi:UDP-glucose:(heptosyl)LPS alpha-1,3-glucosyltransferase
MLTRLTGRQRTLLALERRAALAAGGGGRAGGGGDKTGGPRRIVSLCPMMTEQFRRFYGVDGGRITELASPHMQIAGRGPWDADWSAEARGWFRGNYRIGPDERVALFVGHDFRRKGLRYAIEAIAKTQTRWKLLVVGLGKAREYVELADLLGIGDRDEPARGGRGGARVLFVGPTREMERVYAAADALLLPTFYDPFGLVATEALAHGLPVVSTAFLGPGDLVRRHGVGTIVPDPRAVAEMAAALDGLPAPGSAAAAALAGRARAASAGVTPDEYLRALIGLYESVRGRR